MLKKIFIIFLAVCVGWIVKSLYIKANSIPLVKLDQIKEYALISYPSEFNYRQTILHCGPFSVAAVMRMQSNAEVKSADVVNAMKWRIPNMGYHPWGLEKLLKSQGIEIEVPNLDPFNEVEKVQFLQQRLSEGKPIILLGEKNKVQHYMTLFGFDSNKDEFYIYDSWHTKAKPGFTEDDNGDLPGNRTLKTTELLDFWSNGGVLGAYKWYAIVNSI